MKLSIVAALASVGLWAMAAGCYSGDVKVDLGSGERAQRPSGVDSQRIPETSSHEDARQKLREAYAYIQQVEDERNDLKHDLKKCERDKDELDDEIERLEDRLERCEDRLHGD